MKYLIELHAHTAEVSACGQMPAEMLVDMCKEAGYGAIVITDHMTPGFYEEIPSLNVRAEKYLEGYRRARAHGEKVGLNVLLGVEARIESAPYDYLIFGATEGDIPALIKGVDESRNIRALSKVVHSLGLLIVQAHPYRTGHQPSDPKYLDGYEVVNGNPRHLSGNEKIQKYVRSLGNDRLIMTAGSDAHRPEDVKRAGIVSPVEIKDNAALVKFLRENPHPEIFEAV